MNHRMSMLRGLGLALGLAGALASAQAQVSASGCGSLANGYGPFDYRKATPKDLAIVEDYHFTPRVEGLLGGTTGPIGGDIAYTLHAYPNHHRALIAMMRVGERDKTTQPTGARYPVECYMERAVRFARDDAVALMIYATYLIQNKRDGEARARLEKAREIGKENPFTQFNVGMLYFDMKDYERALAQAQLAQRMGFERATLKERLQGVGRWKEPGQAHAEPAAAPASAAASAADASPVGPPPADAPPAAASAAP